MNNLNWDISDLFRVYQMAHAMCMEWAGFLIVPLSVFGVILGIGYFRFVYLNYKIAKSQQGNAYFKTKSTFRSFRNVFLWCGLAKIMRVVCLFVGLYPIMVFIDLMNSIWIVIANYLYSKNLKEFTTHSITVEQAKAEQTLTIDSLIDAIEASPLDLDHKRLLYKEAVAKMKEKEALIGIDLLREKLG